LTKKWIGLSFGRVFLKPIWSPWLQKQYEARKVFLPNKSIQLHSRRKKLFCFWSMYEDFFGQSKVSNGKSWKGDFPHNDSFPPLAVWEDNRHTWRSKLH
jgi:hypothetical protein